MFRKFYPSRYVDSTYLIDFEELYKKGIRGLIFDIDNTLVEHGVPADKRAIELFKKLRAIGFKTCLISNNKESRVKPFARAVSSKYIYKANKPSRRNYIKAMKMMHTGINNTCFIGDQLFTDVYGANRCKIMSILVKPIHPKEEIQIVLKRRLESVVLFFYKKQKAGK